MGLRTTHFLGFWFFCQARGGCETPLEEITAPDVPTEQPLLLPG